MTKTIFYTIFFALPYFLIAQNDSSYNQQRFIAVTGSAELSIAPDEIELTIILKEYIKGKTTKINLEKIEKKFISVLEKHHIDTKEILLSNQSFYWYYWWSYRRNSYSQKTYQIRLSSSTDFLSLVKDLDMEGVHSLRISNSFNKELQRYRKEVKIAAIKAAKEKASYLLESIDEQVGMVLSVEEVPDNSNYYWRRNQNLISNVSISAAPQSDGIENVSQIKLRYEVKTKFAIHVE